MTRTVADAALLMDVLSQPDARDSMSLPPQDIAWRATRALTPARPAHRPAAGGRLRPAGGPEVRAAVERAARLFEARRRRGRADAALHDPRHAGRHGPLLAHALAWSTSPRCPREGARCCPSSQHWADSAAGMTGEAVFRGLTASSTRCARPRSRLPALRLRDLADVAGAGVRGRAALARPTTRCGRWSTSASPCPSTCREQPAASINCGYTAAACRSACRSPASASTTWACCRWRAPSS